MGIIAIIAALGALVALSGYAAYRMAFERRGLQLGRPKKKKNPYAPYQLRIDELRDYMASTPGEEVSIRSRDGLRLVADYYEQDPGAPLIIMCHGYRSSAFNDAIGGFHMGRELGYNLLLIDQRAHGRSEGTCITFGVRERYDVLDWVQWANTRLPSPVPILLYGVSMGAATVMMAADLPLPENVAGILADCGYDAPEAIIRKVCGDMHYPHRLAYPLLRAAARILGHFDPNEATAARSLQQAKVPVLFLHGEEDDFVPCDMSRRCHAVCASPKTLVTFPGAGHAMSFLLDEPRYRTLVQGFMRQCCGK